MATAFSLSDSGSWKGLEKMLRQMKMDQIRPILESAGAEGVAALASATPVDSGLASSSWSYKIDQNRRTATISWINTNTESGFEVAIALQYGYATGTGGWVQGRDYINPAMQPVMDRIANKVWKAVTSA